MNFAQKSLILSAVLALGAFALITPALSLAEENASDSAEMQQDVTPTQAPSPTNAPDTSHCIPTDVKGSLNYSGDHISGNPVTGTFVNIASDANCSDDIYVHVFGTNNVNPHEGNWLTSQVHVASHTFSIPQGGSKTIEVSVPNGEFCWYQVDATRTSEVRIPPIYHGNDMIDYVLVKNKDCAYVTPTPTVTPTVTPTAGPTATPTPGSGGGSSENKSENKTVESVQASIENTTMAKTGSFTDFLMNGTFVTGMIVSALGALSYGKDKKTSGAF